MLQNRMNIDNMCLRMHKKVTRSCKRTSYVIYLKIKQFLKKN